jgi:hypothetical protein
MRRLGILILTALLANTLLAAEWLPIASWSFDGPGGDGVRGFRKTVDGVAGQALRFDGQTTAVVRAAAKMPHLGGAFSVEAWVALQNYPWTWCAVVNQEKDRRAGYLFGIDPEGRFGLQLAVNGRWQECRSNAGLPLYAWHRILGAFDPVSGLKLYLNGRLVGEAAVSGSPLFAPDADVWIGRNQTPLGLTEEIRVVAPVAFSFDGIIDEVRLYDAALSPSEAAAAATRVRPSGPAPLGPPVLPSGPKGPGRFGAYYTRLRYAEEWEKPWRIGEAADVVVRFDETPNRLVFWRGTSYIPAWVTENGIWYTNEFYETQVPTMATSAEPMADKQARFSHPRILESNEARVVVLWRYAPVSVNYDLVNVDPLTGWGDWVEETYTVYPDGSCVRKIRVWSSKPRVDPAEGKTWDNFRQYHEAIIINPPGTRPEDNIRTEALTLANMKGQVQTYSWADGPPGEKADFDAETLAVLHRISDLDTSGHKWLVRPAGGNILKVNLKSRYSPYVIVDPRNVAIDCYAGEIIRERSIFPWWNHWPVSQQIRSSGRWALAPDRVSHSSLAHIQSWRPFEETADGVTMLMLNGLTDKPADALLPLAESWLSPPAREVEGRGVSGAGFDPAERAFVVARTKPAGPARLTVTLRAAKEAPTVNPVLRVRHEIDGRPSPLGKDVRAGLVPGLEGAISSSGSAANGPRPSGSRSSRPNVRRGAKSDDETLMRRDGILQILRKKPLY